MTRSAFPLLALGLTVLLATEGLADGTMTNGVSPRSIGRGGTNIAFADNGSVLFDNPAGAVNVEGDGLVDFGGTLVLTDFRYADPANSSARSTELCPLPEAAFIRRSADGQWALGLGVFTPAGFCEEYDLEGSFPFSGRRHYKSFAALGKFLPAAAFRATDRLSLGATLGVGVTHAELEGPYFLQGPGSLRGLPTLLDLQGTGATLVWSAGLQYALSETTTLGLAYQSESRFHLHGSTRVDVPGLGQTAYDSRVDMAWPRSVGAGIRHALCRHRIVSADVLWYDWSNAFDDFGIHLTRPTNPLFPNVYEQFPLGWRDTVSVRLGYEYVFEQGQVLRCGYVHHRNPVPDGTLTPYIQAIHEHAFSIGYGFECLGWEVDLAYMFLFGPDQPVDPSSFVGGDFDGALHEAQAHAVAFGLTRRF
ncbi:MAG: outer membrane protein transport protein [Thermoguttaceae bacterium]|nr:outer membrane protein transport protein [Thermoguttaceae bacterium]